MQTWSEMLTYHAERRPDRLFIADAAGEATYGQMRGRMARRASWLAEFNVQRGDRVAVLGRNSVVLIEVLLACQHLGAVAVPLNLRLAIDELGYMLDQSSTRLVLSDAEYAELATHSAEAAAVRPPAVEFDDDDDLSSFAEQPPLLDTQPDEVCRIIYTSGTTSRPKGVMISNGGVFEKSVQQAREFGFAYHEHGLLVGPLYHVAAFDVTLTNVTYVGGSLRIHRRFDPAQTLDTLIREPIAHAWLAPVMVRSLLDAAERSGVVLDAKPRLIIGGGEPTPPDLLARFRSVFPNTWYANVYGLTETGTGDTVLHESQMYARMASIGTTVAGADVAVIDEQGHRCPPGVTGQVAIGGPKLSPGYWNDPDATAASQLDGRFCTGDAGFFDEEGYLFLVGRFKDMIVSGGENIAAAEVERVLLTYPGVLDAAVVGRTDPQWGEVPVAFLVATGGGGLDTALLDKYCGEQLGRLKRPRHFFFVDELPRTGIGKVRKGDLRELARRSAAESDSTDRAAVPPLGASSQT